jgi:hypothetical protein
VPDVREVAVKISAEEATRILTLSTEFGVPTLTAALAARLAREGKGVAAAKVMALAAELAKEYEPRSVPADRSCLRCGAYTTTGYCSSKCARGGA